MMIVSDVKLVCVCVWGGISCLDLCFVMQLRYETEKINSQFPTKRDSIKKKPKSSCYILHIIPRPLRKWVSVLEIFYCRTTL